VRQPKGDLDISHADDYHFKVSFSNKNVKEYQEISKENRTYNFIDNNNILEEQEIGQLCKMETKSGLVFLAKKPEYIFMYKLRELLVTNFESILEFNYGKIESKNLLRDVEILFCLACIYAGYDRVVYLIYGTHDFSATMNKIKNDDPQKYDNIVTNVISYLELNSKEYISVDLKK
jgi:hypothetical protein